MYFRRLNLTFFRNYPDLALDFGMGVVCFTGNNGEGKSNLLEGIHYLAMARGFHSGSEKYSLKEGEQFFMAEGCLVEGPNEEVVQCNYLVNKGKKILVKGSPLPRISAHIGRIPLLSVLPEDTELIHGGPALRRKMMDTFISQYDPQYLQRLIGYERVLEQRNALLGKWLENRYWDSEQLLPWDLQLRESGRYIMSSRLAFLEEFVPHFRRFFSFMVSEKEEPSVDYEGTVAGVGALEWEEAFRAHRDRDRFSGRTGVGIHRDDLSFKIDGNEVKNYGSQGQQKTFLVAIRMAQYALLREKKGVNPLLLLDDIFDKLDHQRMGKIAKLLDSEVGGQVFITDTSFERCQSVFSQMENRKVMYFSVAGGSVFKTEEYGKEK